MIIVLAPGDATIVRQSRAQSSNFPEIYGETYVAGRDRIPEAGPNEDVFFIGHGIARGGTGNAEIGEARGDFAVNGLELWESCRDVFPTKYDGNVYIDACQSANYPAGMFSLIETFRSQFDRTLGRSSVFGRTGSPVGDIPEPDDDAWVEATI